jgi:hypothetical protein
MQSRSNHSLQCSWLRNSRRHSNFQDVHFGVCPFSRLRDTLVSVLVHRRPPAISTTPGSKPIYTYGWTQWIKFSMIELQIMENFCSRNPILMFCITLLLSPWTLPCISTCMIPATAINPRVSTPSKFSTLTWTYRKRWYR